MHKKILNDKVTFFITVILAIIMAVLLKEYVIMTCSVPTGSMQNTIQINDRLIVNRLSYKYGKIKKGDIVAFRYPDDPKQIYIKRVIGLGGDIVDITDGKLYINNILQNEPYLKEPMTEDFGPYKVPEGYYFMLGDNRNVSNDSRYWKNKYVAKSYILGKVVFRYYPINNIGLIK